MHTISDLFPNTKVSSAVADYCVAHSTPLPAPVTAHRTASLDFCERENMGSLSEMMVHTAQAQFMLFLAKSVRARRILEIGTFTGFTSLCWAEAVKAFPDGEVVALDVDWKPTGFAQEALGETGADKVVRMVVGDAAET